MSGIYQAMKKLKFYLNKNLIGVKMNTTVVADFKFLLKKYFIIVKIYFNIIFKILFNKI